MAIEDYYKPIERLENTKTDNGRGGKTYAWVVKNTFQGLINQATSKEIEAANKLGIDGDHKLYCPVDTVLDYDDLIRRNGVYYRVVSDPKNTVERNHHFKIFLKKSSLDQERFSVT